MTTTREYRRLSKMCGARDIIFRHGAEARCNPSSRFDPRDGIPPKTIIAPYPVTVEDRADIEHEIGHFVFEAKAATNGWSEALVEGKASSWAAHYHELMGWPGLAEVIDRLGRKLVPYIDEGLRHRTVTRGMLEREVRADLLAYADRLSERTATNGHVDLDEDEIRGFLAGPPV